MASHPTGSISEAKHVACPILLTCLDFVDLVVFLLFMCLYHEQQATWLNGLLICLSVQLSVQGFYFEKLTWFSLPFLCLTSFPAQLSLYSFEAASVKNRLGTFFRRSREPLLKRVAARCSYARWNQAITQRSEQLSIFLLLFQSVHLLFAKRRRCQCPLTWIDSLYIKSPTFIWRDLER